jgi:hypothetical protein
MSENKKRQAASVGCSEPRLRNSFIFYLNGHVRKRTGERIESHLAHCNYCTDAIKLLTLVKRIQKVKRRDISYAPHMKK